MLLDKALAKERLVKLALPPITGVGDVPAALGAVAAAVCNGEITAGEGASIAALIGNVRQAHETIELGERLAALENY